MQKHVLVVDDEEGIRALLSEALSSAGYLVTTVNDAAEALTLLSGGEGAPVDLLLTDFNLPCLTGLDLIDALRREGKEVPCFLMSGEQNEMLAVEAMSKGCSGFLKKPFALPVLVGHIREALTV